MEADIIIIGAGLSGLVAAAEAADAGRRVLVLDQEAETSLGGQAFWSFGGLLLVDTSEQRLLGIKDSPELAWRDWQDAAAFDRREDAWPRKWAQAYVEFAAGEMRGWLHGLGLRFLKIVAWPERRSNSVPRFHITWGTGPGVLEPFLRRVKAAEQKGLISFNFRHKVTALQVENGSVTGVHGQVLELDSSERGKPSSRRVRGEFTLSAQAVIISAGGIGANHDLVRQHWPADLGEPPRQMLSGVPDYVDGSMLLAGQQAGANVINLDRMWHYPEGIQNFAPLWSQHGVRILSGPTPLWLDAHGRRLPNPLFPGFDARGALGHVCRSGYSHSWFLLNQRILKREFALSGSEHNPDLTQKKFFKVLTRPITGASPVAGFQKYGQDFLQAKNLEELTAHMNQLTGEDLIRYADLLQEVTDRDRQVSCGLGKDEQIMGIRNARRYIGDRIFRISPLHTLTDTRHGPLVAVRLWILTRKTMGGLETNLDAQVLGKMGQPIPGLYAAGETAGFGGGGMHGYRALEGSFLGGCLFSGRIAGRSAAKAIV